MTRYINNTTVRAERQDKDGKEGYNVCNFKKDSNGNLCYFWMNKEDFESDYRSVEAMTFGLAIEAIKDGCKVRRRGWNGKGMWIALSGTQLRSSTVKSEDLWSPHSKAEAEKLGGEIEVLPSIIMKTADEKILMGWLASQTDMLSEDWELAL